jgi:hypothetical protein
MNYRILSEDGGLYEVPENNLSQALQHGTLYDGYRSFSLFDPRTSRSVRASKKELKSYFEQGFRLNVNQREPIRMVDPETLELVDVPFQNVEEALRRGGRPAWRGSSSGQPEFDNTGEGFGLSGKKTWTEALGNFWENPTSYVPFLNAADIFDTVAVYRASQNMKDGIATPAERDRVAR